jgi:hypothetical protein
MRLCPSSSASRCASVESASSWARAATSSSEMAPLVAGALLPSIRSLMSNGLAAPSCLRRTRSAATALFFQVICRSRLGSACLQRLRPSRPPLANVLARGRPAGSESTSRARSADPGQRTGAAARAGVAQHFRQEGNPGIQAGREPDGRGNRASWCRRRNQLSKSRRKSRDPYERNRAGQLADQSALDRVPKRPTRTQERPRRRTRRLVPKALPCGSLDRGTIPHRIVAEAMNVLQSGGVASPLLDACAYPNPPEPIPGRFRWHCKAVGR